MDLLEEYRKEFEQVKASNHDQERKSLRYSNIMTRMEKDFSISIFGRNEGNSALPLYKEVSQARSL
ncbi:hypothetical protein [Halobacillus karajensis]|uniref:Uncharacterized protein n=1 Tax=Halobacillus karajensis TaxID=195088 RepID=A0A024P7M3_9BACI|nr:hypothetical protein [Halobacillus karajensis]CDQ20991.1 hypothetical protein BN982_03352 [Halobacillus karajensis]CDQ24945.1 hypothetical protein BN983_03246 [Halobacillus karajensis]CDQ28694.1 hypothetical protein BN981_03007 [Halobacillus karajensis]